MQNYYLILAAAGFALTSVLAGALLFLVGAKRVNLCPHGQEQDECPRCNI